MRRDRIDPAPLFGCLLAAFLLAGAFGAAEEPGAASGSDWPGFLGPTGDGKSPEKGILLEWPKSGPPILWQKTIGTSYGGPSVSRGRLFLFERRGHDARLVCLKAETGDEIWDFRYPSAYEDLYGYNNGPRTTPVVDGDRVYVFGVEGMLHCVRFEDGKPLWKVDTAAEFGVVQNFFGVGSTPVIEGGRLIVMVGGSPPGTPPIHTERVVGNGSGVVAFDASTGKVAYKLTDELASYASPVLAAIDGRRWCFVFARGGLIGFEPASGKLDFHYPWRDRSLESVNAANPVVVGDRVLISETYGPGSSLLKVKPGGYEVLWKDGSKRDKSLLAHWSTPIHHHGFVYGSSGRHTPEAELRCIELTSGEVRWSVPRLTRASFLYVDGHFIVLNEYGALFVIRANPEKFDLAWPSSLESIPSSRLKDEDGGLLLKYPAWAAPVLSHGLLYVRGEERLVCLDLRAKRGGR
jgi:outer membrane protein assembly factor BamB